MQTTTHTHQPAVIIHLDHIIHADSFYFRQICCCCCRRFIPPTCCHSYLVWCAAWFAQPFGSFWRTCISNEAAVAIDCWHITLSLSPLHKCANEIALQPFEKLRTLMCAHKIQFFPLSLSIICNVEKCGIFLLCEIIKTKFSFRNERWGAWRSMETKRKSGYEKKMKKIDNRGKWKLKKWSSRVFWIAIKLI